MCVRTLDLLFTGLSHLVAERIPDQESAEKWVKGKLNKAFLHFFVNNLMIFQSSTAPLVHSTLKNRQIQQKMKENLVQLASNPFIHRNCGYPKPGFRVLVPPLVLCGPTCSDLVRNL